MRVWIVTFSLIFVLVELCQWIGQFLVLTPLYVLAGAFLAFASSYDKSIGSWFTHKTHLRSVLQQTVTLVDSVPLKDHQKPQTEENQINQP